MKGILCYFSGTGNTKWIADRFKISFNEKGHKLDLFNIEEEESLNLKNYDFIIIGTPVHAETQPKIVDDFIKNLPKSKNNMKCIVYSTQGALKAAAAHIIKKKLTEKNYNIIITEMFKISNNYYFAFGVKPNTNVIEENLKRAEKKVISDVEYFLKTDVPKGKISIIRIGAGDILGKTFRKFLPRMSRNLTSTEMCTKCGLCLRNCPKGNITFQNGQAVFHSNCILCMRCIHICPINGVRYNGKKVEQTQKEIIKCLNLK